MAIPNLAPSAPGLPGKAAVPPSLASAIAGASSANPDNSSQTPTPTFPQLVEQAIAREAGATVSAITNSTKANSACSTTGRAKSGANRSDALGAANSTATPASLAPAAVLRIIVPSLVPVPAAVPSCPSTEVDSAEPLPLPSATEQKATQGTALPVAASPLPVPSENRSSNAIALPLETLGSLEPGASQAQQSGATPGNANATDAASTAVAANVAIETATLQSAQAPVHVVQQPTANATPTATSTPAAVPVHPALSAIVNQVQQLQAQPTAGQAPAPAPATVTLDATQAKRVQRLQVDERHSVEERSPILQTPQNIPASPSVHPKLPTPSAQNAALAPAPSNSTSDSSSKMPSGDSSSGQGQNQASTKSEDSSDPLKPAPDPQSFAQAIHSSSSDPANASATSSASSSLSIPQIHASTNAANSSANPPAAPSSGQPALAHLPDAPGNHFVNTAQLVENAGHSEMRIELQTDKLGNIELRARVVGDELGAAITVEKRDAHAALAVELPALQQALSAKQLRVDQVTLLQGSLSSAAGNAGRDSQQRQAPMANRFQASSAWVGAGTPTLRGTMESAHSGIFDTQGRLNVHA